MFYLVKNGNTIGVFSSLSEAKFFMYDDIYDEEFWAQRNGYYCVRDWKPETNSRHGAKLYLVDEEGSEGSEVAITYVIAKRRRL